ncbi:MAG: GAF domain-containing sensor histidine kinase [Candidatus Manganitrophus sp.]|nr:GAF domain-containing sensor histidine kinase [Candidatus Manganitrophus sp.]
MKDRLIRAVQELSLARDLKTVMEIVRHAGRELTGADGTSFILRDGDLCYYADEEAIGPLWKGKRFPMAACISGWSMLNHQPAVIEDIYDDPRTPVDAYRPTFVQSLAMVPIRTASPIGAIGNYWAARHRATTDEVKLLQMLADSTSIAMGNIQRYEEMEKKTFAAQQASERKSMLLSTVSHELMTPLNAIIGYTDLLIDETFGPVGEGQRMPLEGVQRNASDLLRLIDNLLNLAHIESGKMELRIEPVHLAPLLRELILDLKPLIEHKSVFLRLSVQPNLPPIESDPAKIRQILTNLLTNAIKFTKNGEINVTVKLVQDQGGAELAIRDTGIGISETMRKRIFEPLHQVDGEDGREFGGVGLGLAIVNQLLDYIGGSIRLENELGRGSTFTVFLPLIK